MSPLMLLLALLIIGITDGDVHVNLCVLRCKDNHMLEMENEWSSDFTLPLLSLLRTTRNETAAYIKAQAICTSNAMLENCVNGCNKSQEASIILAGVKAWQDACSNLEEVRAQFPCWRENGEELSKVCRSNTVRLAKSMQIFAKNQTQENIGTICSEYEEFTTCFTQEHGKYCGYRSEVANNETDVRQQPRSNAQNAENSMEYAPTGLQVLPTTQGHLFSRAIF
ncbi:unnamed protein product [Caenorhabditis auriculariae]|uniref:DUF19 domain-containing protein n=1 Tax=Caenorhabditis auriculariae TaxID=2777116 RepID=A0A8S1HAS7_9PELO|nr:unnamed protein product [Caenorhabditis auriculariae]